MRVEKLKLNLLHLLFAPRAFNTRVNVLKQQTEKAIL